MSTPPITLADRIEAVFAAVDWDAERAKPDGHPWYYDGFEGPDNWVRIANTLIAAGVLKEVQQ